MPAGRPRVLRSVYRGSSAQVLHALLLELERPWHVRELTERAQVSASTVHQVCTYLEAQLWMDKRGTGPHSVRFLREPGALLDAWAAEHSPAEYEIRRFHRWARGTQELLSAVTSALVGAGVEHAITPELRRAARGTLRDRWEHVWVLTPADAADRLEEVAQASGWQLVEEGETIIFLVTRDRPPLLFHRPVQHFFVASDVQLYLDLWAWPQRGKEQARHLHAERLGY